MSTPQYPAGPSYPAPQTPPPPPPPGYGAAHNGYGAPQGGFAGQPMPAAPSSGQYFAPSGPIGQIRGTGIAILLCIVTLGIYSLVWYFKVHEEMKRHTGNGLGGALALVLAIFIGVASPFLTSSEVGNMYERAGRPKPVSGATGLWYIPGFIIIVGPIVWFVKTNNALNEYWRSLGAR
ncbi:DUF4234 domain-containing protein [Blastococcus sp. SYSU D00813]